MELFRRQRIILILAIFFILEQSNALINGRAPEYNQFPVLKIAGGCTVSRVSSKHVLIAAHCLTTSDNPIMRNLFLKSGDKLLSLKFNNISGEYDPRASTYTVSVKNVYIHPLWIKKYGIHGATGNRDFTTPDLAVLEVNYWVQESGNPQKVPEIVLNFRAPPSEQKIWISGCGRDENNFVGILKVAPKRIKKISSAIYSIGLADADNGGHARLAEGDSGGPAFSIAKNGALTLLGINSFVNRYNVNGLLGHIARIDLDDNGIPTADSTKTWIYRALHAQVSPVIL